MSSQVNIQEITSKQFSEVVSLIADIPVSPEFYWPKESLLDELENTRGFGLWLHQKLFAVVLWRDLYEAYEISMLATAPEVRGQGHMTQLLRHVFAAHRQKNQWWLEVHEKNLAAQKFYLKMGFIESGRRQNYYRDGGAALLYNYTIKTT